MIIDEKWLFCISEPPLGELGATYDYHLRVIGKHVADFLLMLTELFARCYDRGSTNEYQFKVGDFALTRAD